MYSLLSLLFLLLFFDARRAPLMLVSNACNLRDCPVQFHADKLEERALRLKNYEISKVKNAKAGVVQRLEVSVRGASRNLAEARLPYSDLKRNCALGKAMLVPVPIRYRYVYESTEAGDCTACLVRWTCEHARTP